MKAQRANEQVVSCEDRLKQIADAISYGRQRIESELSAIRDRQTALQAVLSQTAAQTSSQTSLSQEDRAKLKAEQIRLQAAAEHAELGLLFSSDQAHELSPRISEISQRLARYEAELSQAIARNEVRLNRAAENKAKLADLEARRQSRLSEIRREIQVLSGG